MPLEVTPATPDRWPDVLTVMGERGDPSRCFCQYFRLRGKQWSDSSPASNRDSADLYRGPLSNYLDAGFKELSRTSPKWVLVAKSLQ